MRTVMLDAECFTTSDSGVSIIVESNANLERTSQISLQ